MTVSPLDPRAWQGRLMRHPILEIADDAQVASAITWDSRTCDEHTAFVALPGEATHGNAFIAQALERGATFILTDLEGPRSVRALDAALTLRAWARAWRDQTQAHLIGVTGSAGKTTLKEFIAAALEVGKTPGNLNTLNALACYLLSSVKPNETHVIEMGIDRIGEMDQLIELVAPDLGVISNVGPAHLEFFGSIEKIAEEKGRIIVGRRGLVAEEIAHHYTSHHYTNLETYGFGPHATHRGEHLELGDTSATFTYHDHLVTVASPSAKVAEAALAALVIAERFRVPLETAISRVAKVEVPGGRMRLEHGRYTLIDDAYNANPLSVAAALDVLERLPGRKVAVLGDMRELGPEAERYHQEIGDRAGQIASVVIAVGQFAQTVSGAAAAHGASARAFARATDAIAEVELLLEPGDAVLVKGSLSVGMKVIAEAIRARL